MSVTFICSKCKYNTTQHKKICPKCHHMLYYYCQLSNQMGLYNHFYRHRKTCVYCTPTLLNIHTQKKIQTINFTRNEMEETDKGKEKYITVFNFILH